MITHIEGELVEKTPAFAVIDCNGIGYIINISLHTYSQLVDQGRCKLLTHLAVREDAHTLYGFATEKERHLFRNLISVSGVGHSTARLVLSSLTPDEVHSAILSGDVATIKSVKGIGGKTAQRIIVDLKDKLEKEGIASVPEMAISGMSNNIREDALSALITLGFAKAAAEKALINALKTSNTNTTVEELIKTSLKDL